MHASLNVVLFMDWGCNRTIAKQVFLDCCMFVSPRNTGYVSTLDQYVRRG